MTGSSSNRVSAQADLQSKSTESMTPARHLHLLVAALVATMTIVPASGQPMLRSDSPDMMGPHVFGLGHSHMCAPGPAGFVEWRLEQLVPSLKLSDAQRSRFDQLKSSSAKSVGDLQASCASLTPSTMPARMEAMKKRMEAMLAASKAIRPALEEFYASLTSKQKAQLDSGGRPQPVLALARSLVGRFTQTCPQKGS